MYKLSVFLMFLALGCDAKDQATGASEGPVTAAQALAAQAQVDKPKSQEASITTPDGKTAAFATMLVWQLDLGASKAPQLAFFTEAATCEDRLANDRVKFYAAFMGDLEPNDMNELADGDPYQSPNWGYTGLPDFVPGSEDEQGYPPPYWGAVTVTKADEKIVEGTVDFESEGVVVQGKFVAQRCPDM